MRWIAVSQQVSSVPSYGERRDCLDQEWPRFLSACGFLPLALPNIPEVAAGLLQAANPAGLILTGGNSLSSLGGDAPERDATERQLLDLAEQAGMPVIGVCRGMQVLQHRHAVPLGPVAGHTAPHLVALEDGRRVTVNSFHDFGARQSSEELYTWAVADDGVIEAIRHRTLPMTGIMWHPERTSPYSRFDVELFKRAFQDA